ncbi:MAG: cytidylate kinase family protein, partial [Candidatus Kapaibacterium sp.]
MPVVSLLTTPYCNGQGIAQELAAEQNLRLVKDDIVNQISVDYDVPIDKLLEAINGSNKFFAMNSRDRRKFIFYIKERVAAEVAKNNCIIAGFTSLMVPRNISHVLKVCLTGDINFRIDNAINRTNLNAKAARDLIKEIDQKLFNWSNFIYKTNPWDAHLYDIVIPAHKKTPDEITSMISVNLAQDVINESSASVQQAKDFELAARVNAQLAREGHDVDVSARGAHITVMLRKYYLRLEHHKQELRDIVMKLDGVKSVEVKMGPSFNMPFMHIPVDFEVPNKTLLVDDEKEFVETLSERLKTRNIASVVAYDGQSALESIRRDKPDVMVLDLKMPGMGGM